MRDIVLDIRSFEDKVSLHQYFKELLGFSFYYGGNLDALFDELTSNTEALALVLRYPAEPKGKMKDYLPKLLTVFEDAARENYNLSVRYEEVK